MKPTPQDEKSELSPLDQIRRTEAEVTRQIAAAREASKLTVREATLKADALLADARNLGRRQGQKRYQEIITASEEKARSLVAEASSQAEILRSQGARRMVSAVDWAVRFILGIAGNGEEL